MIMVVNIAYSIKKNQQQGNWLLCNLKDFVWSLDVNLRRHHAASCEAKLTSGKVNLNIEGVEPEVVQPYLDAFHLSMKKQGLQLIMNTETSKTGISQ